MLTNASMTASPCLIGVISFVQFRFGKVIPISIFSNAENTQKTIGISSTSKALERLKWKRKLLMIETISTAGAVRQNCSPALERRISLPFTGKDFRIQMFFPSSETEGAAASFIQARMHIANTVSPASKPDAPRESSAIRVSIISFLMTRYTVPANSIRVEREQFSIYGGQEKNLENSFFRSETKTLFL